VCLGIPGRIVGFPDDARHTATVDVAGQRRTINIGMIAHEGVEIGEWVLIHVGFAISKIDEAEARSTYSLLEEIGDALDGELADPG
jgi:hydrogenase expression/formation protein HypC